MTSGDLKLLFCQDPLADRQADARFYDEAMAAAEKGLAHHLLDYDALERGNVARAVRSVPNHREETLAVYRGWSLPSRHYDLLYEALLSRGLRLINTPEAYRLTYYLPESLDLLKDYNTPRTVWFRSDGNISYEMIMGLLIPFGSQPVILRDFVRAQKHYWHEACYIASASDRAEVERVVSRFIALQPHLNGGLMFREYVPLKMLAQGTHMPLAVEYRLVFLDGQQIARLRYWQVEGADDSAPPDEPFATLARAINSRFLTIDIAQTAGDEWIVIDIGDAQTTSLPAMADIQAIYEALGRLRAL
jgi:hypothetical protein